MNRIKELREIMGLKQGDFAREFNVTQGTLSNWERGVHEPDTESLKKMREIFNKTSDYILGLSDDPTPPNKKEPITAEAALQQFLQISDLSEESQKDLLKQLDLLKLRDKIKNMNEEIGVEIMPSF